MKKYNILNNSLGWFCFVVAAVTYLMTLEPTASFWDCPEFILQGFKLEVGHPPGNPIFMLTARFFANFAMGDVTKVALMVNAMSGLLSAGTILLLFWTITHLVEKLIVPDNAETVPVAKMLVIFGSGICGALMYAWSDTFWFSAVEGEVYAFSSFCTALVFWLILKWENRADRPDSDKYLILIAYVIGISIAVHLLNLLCIPAIVLVIYFKRAKNANAKGAILALLISFAIVAFTLYGLVPGLISVAQDFELFCVNTLHMPFNTGVIIYGALTTVCFIWTIYNLYNSSRVNPTIIKISFALSVLLSGILFIGASGIIGVLLFIGLCIYLFTAKGKFKLSVRMLSLITLSIMVMFVGYSSYALLLVRSSAHTPMNQNAPDNVFTLASYLNREQYGDRPLIYGPTIGIEQGYDEKGNAYITGVDSRMWMQQGNSFVMKTQKGADQYAREVKDTPGAPDRYHNMGPKETPVTVPGLNMPFPRMYEAAKASDYNNWVGASADKPMNTNEVEVIIAEDEFGDPMEDYSRYVNKATFGENLKYLLNYQLNHMYWRYFLWNFAGRQNDIQGNGEPTHGNWISGIPALDNARLGDQSLLPDELGKDNPGHNVFFMIPLMMGLFGLFWQAAAGKRGIEQFWVVFFLFFMTGIAIVLYLNQTPGQPRERDYAFAGSFYAYAIWVGMGVAAIWRFIYAFAKKNKKAPNATDPAEETQEQKTFSLVGAIVAAVIGILVPLQVVSQTWDDHDRSGRYTARDFGMNYLNSLDENAIIFTYGDNDTFPLWYAQEVEGVRTDVKVANLSYLTTDWYIDQLRRQSYNAPGIDVMAKPTDYAYDARQAFFFPENASTDFVDATKALKAAYSNADNQFPYPFVTVPANAEAAVKSGRIKAGEEPSDIQIALPYSSPRGVAINSVMVLDILNTSAKNGWNRPVYFATTVPTENYIGLDPYFSQTGLAYEVVPVYHEDAAGVNTEKMYRNITERWRWGGLDKVTKKGQVYLDETVRRMLSSNRGAIFDLARCLGVEAYNAKINPASVIYGNLPDSVEVVAQLTDAEQAKVDKYVSDRVKKIQTLLKLQQDKLPEVAMDYTFIEYDQLCEIYDLLYEITGDKQYQEKCLSLLETELNRFGKFMQYYESLPAPLYNSLSSQDLMIVSYYPYLIRQYYKYSGMDQKKTENLLRSLEKKYKFSLNLQ